MKNQHNSNFDKILKKVVNNNLRKYIKENLKTHDDDIHNIYDKLDELDISYDFINERENIIEIRSNTAIILFNFVLRRLLSQS